MSHLVPRGDSADHTAAVERRHPDAYLTPSAARWLQKGVADNTRRAYSRQADDFQAWCAATGRTPVPAAAETITSYAAHLADCGFAPNSISQAIAAVRTLHHSLGHQPPDTRSAAGVLRALGAERADLLIVVRKAQIFTADDVHAMAASCDRANLAGLREAVVILNGVNCCARRSELTGLDRTDVRRHPNGLEITIRRSKTDQSGQTRKIAVIPDDDNTTTCPVTATTAYCDALDELKITSGPFLRPAGRGQDPHRPGNLSGAVVDQIVRRVAARVGLDKKYADSRAPISAHSLRATGATLMLSAGSPLSAVARIGGWSEKSAELLAYWRVASMWDDHPMRAVRRASVRAMG